MPAAISAKRLAIECAKLVFLRADGPRVSDKMFLFELPNDWHFNKGSRLTIIFARYITGEYNLFKLPESHVAHSLAASKRAAHGCILRSPRTSGFFVPLHPRYFEKSFFEASACYKEMRTYRIESAARVHTALKSPPSSIIANAVNRVPGHKRHV